MMAPARARLMVVWWCMDLLVKTLGRGLVRLALSMTVLVGSEQSASHRSASSIVRDILRRDHRRDVMDRLRDIVDVAAVECAHDVLPFLGMRARTFRR